MRAQNIANRQLSELAQLCLAYLAGSPEDLVRFLELSGYTPEGLRQAVGTTALEVGLIDYFASSEALLAALCSNGGITNERFMAVWQQVNRTE